MTTADARGRRRESGFPVVMTAATAVALIALVALGVWQVQRLHWKEALLARVAAARTAPPEPLGVVLARIPDRVDVDYTRVQADCPNIEQTAFVKLYSVNENGAGFRIISACALTAPPFGSILVDRGFVAEDAVARLHPGEAPALGQPVVGVLRRGDAPNFVTPKNQPGQNLWYWRDIAAMARSLGAARPAPTFLMLEQPAPRGFGPTPTPLPVDIPNNHLQYAITWFGLAAALLGVYLAKLRSVGRAR
jgi:surfeit locus 1 family protein